MPLKQKVIVIGLDCATPQLLFDRYRKDLPNISRMMEQGTWGKMRSTTPPITVPAWAAMTTSQDAGALGVYGFRSRKAGGGYQDMQISHGGMIHHKRVWDYIGDHGGRVGMLGVPQTFPVRPVNGMMVSCFLTPGTDSEFTYPHELRQEILDMVAPDDYIFDFANRTNEPPDKVLDIIYTMTRQRQKIFKHWVQHKPWDFLMMVEMGVDRIHHYLWHYMDPEHKLYTPGNPYEAKILDYYREIDRFIGEVQELAPKETIFYIVSDHGAKRMEGMFVINEWLMQNGYLTLKQFPSTPTSIERCDVDWSKTKAWAWGGFYSRLFLNIKGREPQGIVEPHEVDALLNELREKLLTVKGPNGEALHHEIYKPHELYKNPQGDVPDMLIFWGDLFWKCAGTVGYHSLYIDKDDRGLDFGVHDWHGVFIKCNPTQHGSGEREGIDIRDVTPTILSDYGIPPTPDMQGKVIT